MKTVYLAAMLACIALFLGLCVIVLWQGYAGEAEKLAAFLGSCVLAWAVIGSLWGYGKDPA